MMKERRKKEKNLLQLFEKVEQSSTKAAKTAFGNLVAQVTVIMTVPATNNFQQLVAAHQLYPKTFDRVIKELDLPKTLGGLLRLYLKFREVGLTDPTLRETLQEARAKAFDEGDDSTLEEFAERGLVHEFSTVPERGG